MFSLSNLWMWLRRHGIWSAGRYASWHPCILVRVMSIVLIRVQMVPLCTAAQLVPSHIMYLQHQGPVLADKGVHQGRGDK